jgi:phosphoglycerate kinase
MTESGATTIIAGGNTIELCNKIGVANKMSFASSGGGATLEFLSGETLPGIEALELSK